MSNFEWTAWVHSGGDRHTMQNQQGHDMYVVDQSNLQYRGTWHFERTSGLMIGPVVLGGITSFQHPDANAAKLAALQDYRQIVRLNEWFKYMVDNPPPQ
jgi:hypothetical protein